MAYAFSSEVDADAAEVDIRLTADGEVVVMHDATVDRTTNGSGAVADFIFPQLRRLDAGSWKTARYAGARVPSLDEAIAAVPAGKRLFIEIKSGPRTVPRLSAVLAGCGRPAGQFPIISFDMRSIALAKRVLPQHECYLVTAFRGRIAFLSAFIRRVKAAGLDGIDAHYPASRALLTRLEDNGLKSLVWTVNHIEGARRMVRFGARGITTDIPRRLCAALRPVASRKINFETR